MASSSRPQMRVGVDARGLTQLYRDLLDADKDIAREFLTDIKAAGESVRADAVGNAPSERIADTIRLVSSGGNRGKVKVSVRAGGKDAPHAEPLEHGGKPGSFRHPVFGNRRAWVSQDAHPFLIPALQANLAKVQSAVTATVDKMLARHRL